MAQMVDKDPDVAFTQKLALFQEYAGISVTGDVLLVILLLLLFVD